MLKPSCNIIHLLSLYPECNNCMHAYHSIYNGTRQGVELMQVSLNWYNILHIMHSQPRDGLVGLALGGPVPSKN